MTEAWPKRIPARDVFSFVKGIIEAGREDEFLKECYERDVRVAVLVSDLKAFVGYVQTNNILQNSLWMQRVIDPDKCDC